MIGFKTAFDYWYYGGVEGLQKRAEQLEAEYTEIREAMERNRRSTDLSSDASGFSTLDAVHGLYTTAADATPVKEGARWNGPARLLKPARDTPEEEEEKYLKAKKEWEDEARLFVNSYPIQNPVDKKESNVFDGHYDKRIADYLNKDEDNRMLPDMHAPYAPNHHPDAVREWKIQQVQKAAEARDAKIAADKQKKEQNEDEFDD